MVLQGIFTESLATFFAVVPLLFNTLLLYLLAVSFIIAVFAGGNWIVRKLKLFQEIRRQETLLTFGIGLVTFLIVMQILMGIQLFYSAVMWVLFAGLLVLARFERNHLKVHEDNLITCLESWHTSKKSVKF